jgi:hypothetical protein
MSPDIVHHDHPAGVRDRDAIADRLAVKRNVVTATAALAALAGLASTAAWHAAEAVRPPCPDGYVRFLDFDGLLQWFGLGVCVAGLVTVLLARHARRTWGLVLALALCIGLVGSVSFVGGVSSWHTYRHEQFDSCWTF